MELEGRRLINLDRQVVWENMNYPEVLAVCIPGCQELIGSVEEGFSATIKQRVGPVSATFSGSVRFEDVIDGEGYTIIGEGKGGVAGFAKGQSKVRLIDTPEGCELSYLAEAKIGGKLAQLGSRIIGGFSKKFADQFFEKFQEEVEARS
jgi:carbon monoxide dehydrogenase subunit G